MPVRPHWMTQAFIERQKARLLALRSQLLGLEASRVRDVQSFNEERGDEAQEYEDRAQDAARDGVRQAVHDVDEHRVHAIERALKKIEQGTYGRSDASGQLIPQGRLEATPEAVLTVDEAAAR